MPKNSVSKTVTAMLAAGAVALGTFASTSSAFAKPVSGFMITISKVGGKPTSYKTTRNGYVWQVVEAGKYTVKAKGKEITVNVGREGKLWINVDQDEKGQTTLKADGGELVVVLKI